MLKQLNKTRSLSSPWKYTDIPKTTRICHIQDYPDPLDGWNCLAECHRISSQYQNVTPIDVLRMNFYDIIRRIIGENNAEGNQGRNAEKDKKTGEKEKSGKASYNLWMVRDNMVRGHCSEHYSRSRKLLNIVNASDRIVNIQSGKLDFRCSNYWKRQLSYFYGNS